MAKKTWKNLENHRCVLYTSEYVLDELLTLISKRASHYFACQIGNSLLESQIIHLIYVQDEQILSIFEQFKKYVDKVFSFTDVCSFYLMRTNGIQKVFTYDDDFLKAGFATIR